MAGLLGMLQKAGNGLLSGIHTIDAGLMYGPNWRQIEDQQRTESQQQAQQRAMQQQLVQLQLAQAQKASVAPDQISASMRTAGMPRLQATSPDASGLSELTPQRPSDFQQMMGASQSLLRQGNLPGSDTLLEQAKARMPKAPDFPAEVQEYQFYAQQESALGRAPASFNDWRLQARRAGATNLNVSTGAGLPSPPTGMYRPDKTRPGLAPEPGAPGKTPTDTERGAAGYLGRMEAAEKKLGNYQPSMTDYAAALNVMEGGPMRTMAANQVLSPQGKNYYQAAADWVRAKLRQESGAVISPQEMAQEIKTYFPVPGDDPATIAQKKQAREQAMAGQKTRAGAAMPAASGYLEQSAPSDPLGILR